MNNAYLCFTNIFSVGYVLVNVKLNFYYIDQKGPRGLWSNYLSDIVPVFENVRL